jgi:hypothetical protein
MGAAMAGFLLLVNCGGDDPAEDDDEEQTGCSKDSDCSSGRICESGECVSAPGTGGATSTSSTATTTTTSTGGGSGNATVLIENYSSYTVYFLYATSCSSSNWGADLLGSSVIGSGQSVMGEFSPGCWDFRAEGSGGVYWESYGNALQANQFYTWPLTN